MFGPYFTVQRGNVCSYFLPFMQQDTVYSHSLFPIRVKNGLFLVFILHLSEAQLFFGTHDFNLYRYLICNYVCYFVN